VPQPARRNSREAALVELQRLHAAIQASRARRGVPVDHSDAPAPRLTAEAVATRELTRRLQTDAPTEARAAERRSRRLWWIALTAAAVVGGVWAAMTLGRRPADEAARTAPVAAPTQAPSAATAPAVPEASSAAATPPATSAPARAVRVTLDTIRPVWLRVIVDGTSAIEREIAAGEHLAFEGDTRILVRAGDGGGIRASFNGVDRGPLGKDGFPITVPFAAEVADAAGSATPARPAAATGPAAAPAATARAVRVTLDTIRPVWLRVFVDGTSAIEREIAAGEHLTFEGDTRIVVRAGDGGGVRASFNGVDRGALGTDGRPITVPFGVAAPAPAPTSPPPE
jgi:hypothetical protein